ncbi:MAG: hypothetical protein CME06_01775 [Gemmatimonadetes bacterium]|nr:hypothetical protein [Gemmatimonadota bacterium]
MSTERLLPLDVLPGAVGEAVDHLPYWFVIGGQAVRCLCPYRPSRDVDFGVRRAEHLPDLVAQLEAEGEVEMLERTADTAHLIWDGIRVSIFVLDRLAPHTEERRLTVRGILATKMHAIIDRGTRRDFFDLYVVLQSQRMGIADALSALREVYRQGVGDGLLLRALTYFVDAEREAPLVGEGDSDWQTIKKFFQKQVGTLLVPPMAPLEIQSRRVDVRERN